MNERDFEILLEALKDILAEISALRRDYREAQAVIVDAEYPEFDKVAFYAKLG